MKRQIRMGMVGGGGLGDLPGLPARQKLRIGHTRTSHVSIEIHYTTVFLRTPQRNS